MRILSLIVLAGIACLPWLASCESRSPKSINVGCSGGAKPDANGKCGGSADANANDPFGKWNDSGAGYPTPTSSGTIPPGSGTVPPGSRTIPPGSGTIPPGSGTIPPGSGTIPPGGSTGINTSPIPPVQGQPEYLEASVMTTPVLNPDGHSVYLSLSPANAKAALVAAFGTDVQNVSLTCTAVHLATNGMFTATVAGTWKAGALTCTIASQEVTISGGTFTGDCR